VKNVILYNWRKIYVSCNKSSREILKVIRYLTLKPKILTKKHRYYRISKVDWSGHSFLLNPEALFSNRHKYDDLEIVHYIGLASLRNYGEYKIKGTKTLDLLACKGKEDIINNNRLLYAKNGKVYFIFEEDIKEKK
jgi:hypothetical protein